MLFGHDAQMNDSVDAMQILLSLPPLDWNRPLERSWIMCLKA